MTVIVVQLPRWDHQRSQRRLLRTTRDAGLRTRALIVLHAATGKGTAQIADAVGYDPSAVLKVLHRYRAERTRACGITARTMGTPKSTTRCGPS